MGTNFFNTIVENLATILVAGLLFWTAFLNRKLNKAIEQQKVALQQQQLTIEQQKLNMEKQKFAEEQLKVNTSGLRESVKCIQKVKDGIQMILAARGTSLPKKQAITDLEHKTEELVHAYEEHHGSMMLSERIPAHAAKKIAIRLRQDLTPLLEDHDFASELSEDDKNYLEKQMSKLSELQNVLHQCMTDRICEYSISSHDKPQ